MRPTIPAARTRETRPDPGSPPNEPNPTRWPPSGLARLVAAAALFLVAIEACDPGGVAEPAPSLEIVPDSVTLTHLGQEFTFSVRGGGAVQWRSRNTAVATVDAGGTVTARGNGVAHVHAWTPELSDLATVHVRQAAAMLEPFGQGQRAAPGLSLLDPVGVRALDAGGAPVSGASVRFEPTPGSGRVEPGEASSDSAGVATVTWTLGPVPGRHTLAVSSADASAEIIATALEPDEAAASIEARSEEDQWAVRERALPDSVAVRVLDEAGRPVRGASVRFEPEAESGRADPGETTTDSLGLASAAWTLGATVGMQRLAAKVGDRLAVIFEATAVSDEGVCNRTPTVSEGIVEYLKGWRFPVSGCADVDDGHLVEVEVLYLMNRGIRELRTGDFAGLRNLSNLHLSGNRLTELPEDIFADLTGLEHLSLDHNQLSKIPEKAFRGTPSLGALDLSFNRLTALPEGILAGLPLEIVYLVSNDLEELPSGVFTGLSALRDLRLQVNRITELPPDIFAGLTDLRLLMLGGNGLTVLPHGVFEDLSSLEELSLSPNAFESLSPDIFAGLAKLERLRLGATQLADLPPGLFSETPALRRLYLEDNRLTALPGGIFDDLPELFRLDLSFNDLAELPPGVFAGTPKLAQLSLEYNDLAELPRGAFAGLSELEWATLGRNPGAPFPVRPEFARIDSGDPLAAGPATLVARVPVGAPFAFDVPVSVQRGTISRDFVSLLPGDTASAPFTVAGTDAGLAAHVGFGPAPEVAAGHTGLAVERGEELVLFAETDNRSPFARSALPAHRMQAGGPSAESVLGDYFGDPDGDPLAYSVETIDAGVVEAGVEDGVLRLDPLTVDTTEVEVTATDPEGLRATQRFLAWVVPAPDPDAFDIELFFDPGFTAEEEATIRRAAARWMEVVTGDLPDVPVRGTMADYCYRESPNLRLVGVVDDVLIRMRLVSHLDGNVATAGYCGERESGFDFVATNSFALWYARHPLREPEDLYRIALHEIGHVLGFGDWIFGTSPKSWRALVRTGDGDAHFAGPLAVAAFDAAGGEGYTGGKVPLEDQVPVLGIHWRYRVIPDDVMSPFAGSLLTAITLQALADIGHEVDVSKADPYTLPSQAHADVGGTGADAEGAQTELPVDDVIRGPVVVVDQNGKVVRVIRR